MRHYRFISAIVLTAILSYSANILAQESNIEPIKGYVVYTYKTSDIEYQFDIKLKETEADLSNEKVSFPRPYEYLVVEYFVPASMISDTMPTANSLYSGDTLYVLTKANGWESGFKFIFKPQGIEANLSKERCILPTAIAMSPYYVGKNKPLELKRVFYIEGYAVKVNRTDENTARLATVFDFKQNNKVFYLINKITSYTTVIDLQFLTPWYPYLNK